MEFPIMYHPRFVVGNESLFYEDDRPVWLRLRSSLSFIVGVLALSLFTDVFLHAMMVPILPTALVSRAGVSLEDREYWNSALLLLEAVSALLCMPMILFSLDVSNRQEMYLFSFVILSGSMAFFINASSVMGFMYAKVLQGASTAMMTVSVLEILNDAVDKHQAGEMIGYVSTAMILGVMSGSPIGGIVFEFGGYYSILSMGFGILALDMALRLCMIEKRFASRWLTLPEYCPYQGYTYISGYFSCETVFNQRNSSSTRTGGSLDLVKLLRQSRILISLWAVIVSALVISAFDATLAVFVQDTFHSSALGSGSIFIPITFAALLQPFAAYISQRFGCRIIAFVAFAALSPTLICLRFIGQDTAFDSSILCVFLLGIGLCINLAEPALLIEIQRVLKDMETENPSVFGDNSAVSQAFSLQIMARFGAFVFGPIQGGFISFYYGWDVMTLSLGVLSLLTAVSMLWLSGERDSDGDAERQPLISA